MKERVVRSGYEDCLLPWKAPLPNPQSPGKYRGICITTPIALMDKLSLAEKVEKAPTRSQ